MESCSTLNEVFKMIKNILYYMLYTLGGALIGAIVFGSLTIYLGV